MKVKQNIGGAAVINGIEMKSSNRKALAVRDKDGGIFTESKPLKKRGIIYKIPILRGIFAFGSSITDSYKALMKSADISLIDEEPDKIDKWIEEKFGDKGLSVLGPIIAIIAAIISITMLVFLPSLIADLFNIPTMYGLRALFEGIFKIIVMVAYMYFISKLDDIKTTFMYHGAEHKTISCYESGKQLTVANVRESSRFHKRCGTSFLVFILIISVPIFSIVTAENLLLRSALKISLLPVIMGISYEIIKLAGKYDNPIISLLSAPGVWLQRITTKEPTDEMIEVAIAAVELVLPKDDPAIVKKEVAQIEETEADFEIGDKEDMNCKTADEDIRGEEINISGDNKGAIAASGEDVSGATFAFCDSEVLSSVELVDEDEEVSL